MNFEKSLVFRFLTSGHGSDISEREYLTVILVIVTLFGVCLIVFYGLILFSDYLENIPKSSLVLDQNNGE